MTIDQAKEYIFSIARKNQYGNVAIGDLNLWFQRAQLDIVNELRQVFVLTSIIDDNISPLVTPVPVYANPTGQFIKPSDYLFWVDFYSNTATNSSECGQAPAIGWAQIELVAPNKFSYRMNSGIVTPDIFNPIGVEYDGYYSVYPVPNVIQLTYVRTPKPPFWNGTDDGFELVYNPVGSQDFELPEITHEQICFRVLTFMGIATRDAELYQTVNESNNQGS